MPATIATRATKVNKTKPKSKAKHGMAGVGKKSKTKDPACSSAMSSWKSTGMTKPIAIILAKCRAKAAGGRKAELHRAAGHELKAQVMEHRVRTGEIGAGHRAAKAQELIRKRHEKLKQEKRSEPVKHEPIKTSLKEQAAATRGMKGLSQERKISIISRLQQKVSKLKSAGDKKSLERARKHERTIASLRGDKPKSLKEQAAEHRAAKGTREQRSQAIVKSARTKVEKINKAALAFDSRSRKARRIAKLQRINTRAAQVITAAPGGFAPGLVKQAVRHVEKLKADKIKTSEPVKVKEPIKTKTSEMSSKTTT